MAGVPANPGAGALPGSSKWLLKENTRPSAGSMCARRLANGYARRTEVGGAGI